MNRKILVITGFFCLLFSASQVKAMPLGALVYRTSGNGLMYGYNTSELVVIKKDIISDFYSGHVGIYIGEEDGKHYVVEALADGVVKNEAQYFVNYGNKEKYLGAKLPKEATAIERLKAVEIAKRIAELGLGYDSDFRHQKGPKDNQWTCVGLTEKVYESAAISNPYNLSALEYDPDFYAVDITPDGFDDDSVVNSYGDTFAKAVEFSQIVRRTEIMAPAKEIIGYDAGYEYRGKRYFFLPYTQYLQPSLEEVETDIEIGSDFKEAKVRGSFSQLGILLKWSFINNPVSTVKNAVGYVARLLKGEEDLGLPLLSGKDGEDQEEGNIVAVDTSESENQNATLPLFSLESWEELAAETEPETVVSEPLDSDEDDGKEIIEEEEEYFLPEEERQEEMVKVVSATVKPSVSNSKVEISASLPRFSASSTSATKQAKTEAKKKVQVVQGKDVSQGGAKNGVSLPSRPIAIPTTASSSSGGNKQDEDEEEILPLLIRRLYATGSDDWLEIYNPNSTAIDLAEVGYRLEKAKTALDPSIMLRFDKAEDVEFLYGSVIPSGQSMVVADDAATSTILAQAHAIAKNVSFGWRGDGYSIYLASGPVSSPQDEDIIDLVGFGAAVHYEASPAPAITDNYILWRKPRPETVLADLLSSGGDRNKGTAVDTDNNGADFLLVPLVEQVEEDEEEEEEDDDTGEQEEPILGNGDAISVSGLTHLWHFDECFGQDTKDYRGNNDLDTFGHWEIGYFGCGLGTLYTQAPRQLLSPGETVDGNNFTALFWMHAISDRTRTELKLEGDRNAHMIRVIFNPTYIQVEGLPKIEQYQYPFSPQWLDGGWHLAAFSMDEAQGKWSIYLDGEEFMSRTFPTAEMLPFDFSSLILRNDNELTPIDDLALFDRGLSAAEIKDIYRLKLPFAPPGPVWEPLPVALKHFWDFNETTGDIAADSVGDDDFQINGQAEWVLGSRTNSSLRQVLLNSSLGVDLAQPFAAGDLSFSFWWYNSIFPAEGWGELQLLDQYGSPLLSFSPSWYNGRYFLGTDFWRLSRQDVFNDEAWHNIVLSYDRLAMRLTIYVDGQEFLTDQRLAWPLERELTRVQTISNSDRFDIDDISIWQGALSAADAAKIYQDGRVERLSEEG